MNSSYDLVIIGGGPAGYTAAIKGAQAGYRVALIENSRIGGACINRGCVPTKALWGTAISIQRLKDLKEHGIQTSGSFTFDFGAATKRQFAIMDQMVARIEARLKKLGVVSLAGSAKIDGKEKSTEGEKFVISVDEGKQRLLTRYVLIATGSRPIENEVLKPDHKTILTTDDIVVQTSLPKTLAIVGGGVVACEFASILFRFGVKAVLLEHSSQVLAAMDQEVVSMLMGYFQDDGIDIRLHTRVKAVEKTATGVRLTLDRTADGKQTTETLETEQVLMAIGRRPNSDKLGLESLGVKIGERGNIVVNERLETSCKGIYAAGDVTGGQMLAHKAWYEASLAVRAMSGVECATNYDTVPGAIFTIPEMAAVGLQPEQARQRGINVAIGKFPYAENAQAMCTGKTRGMIKAVIDRDTGKVIGCTMLGHDASNLISEVALAIEAGLTANDIGETIHPHPTLSEMVWESFLDTQGLAMHKSLS